ncbi:MAG: DsbA family protein [bacterium]|nr:DsbA family protein [bacterium]
MEENITTHDNVGININKNNNQKQIAGAIILAGVLIAGAILLKNSEGVARLQTTATDQNKEMTSLLKPISTNEHILGNPKAKIMVVEYSDTECPFCKMFHSTMHTVVEKNNGDVAWVYRHYPIPELHQKAFREAEATECSWEQGGNDIFWRYTDEIYVRTQSNDTLNPAELPKIAGDIGLDVLAFNTCLKSGKYKTKVQNDIDDGQKLGVRGTPSSFIVKNGKVVDTIAGAQPLEVVNQKIENVLK